MSRLIVRQWLFVGIVTLLGIGIAGCGSKVSGKYVGGNGMLTIDFKSGQATVSDTLGNTETSDYVVSGKSVTIHSKQRGDLQFTLADDGSLSGQGVTLTKAAD